MAIRGKSKRIPPNQTGKHWKLSEKTRENQRKAQKGRKVTWGDKIRLTVNKYYENPQNRKKTSDAIKKKWRDPIYWQKCSDGHKGERCNWYKGGIQFEPYTTDWTDDLKRAMRKRDHYTCRVCGKEPAICVHHIDYNKKNCSSDNLITLCFRCHNRTNHNRDYWINYFRQPQRLNESTPLQKR